MIGWCAVGAVAAGWDLYALRRRPQDTLSRVAGKHPGVTLAATAGLLFHFNAWRFWPPRRRTP